MNTHSYDKAGICIYCDLCPDDRCCWEWEEECSRRNVVEMSKMVQRIHEEFRRRSVNDGGTTNSP